MTDTKRIGFFLPVLFLLIFSIVFHPSIQELFWKFDYPWEILILSPQMFFLLAAAFIISKKKISLESIGASLRDWKKNAALGLIAGIIPYVLLLLTNWIVGTVNPSADPPIPIHWTGWVMASMFILAPLSEELFFRGIVFHALKETYSIWVSIFASALLFMACHSPMMIGPFVLGCITAFMTQKTGSLLPAILFHVLSNSLPLFFANYCQHLLQYQHLIFIRF